MKKFRLKTYKKKFLVDTITPVSVYLRIRDKYPNSLLLESSDYNSNNNSFSYICFNHVLEHYSLALFILVLGIKISSG